MTYKTEQKDTFSCGAIAVYNALIAVGGHVGFETIKKILKTAPGKGTRPRDLVRGARKLGLSLRKIQMHHLKFSGMYIVRFSLVTEDGLFRHYVFINNGVIFNFESGEKEDVAPLTWVTRGAVLQGDSVAPCLVWKVS